MLSNCDFSDTFPGRMAPAEPAGYRPRAALTEAGPAMPTVLPRTPREWAYSLGGAVVLSVALFLLLLLADEAMEGSVLIALLRALGWA